MVNVGALPGNLRWGAAILLTLALLALTAPLLATSSPWLARDDHGLVCPLLTGTSPGGPNGKAEAILLSAPIPYGPARGDLTEVLLPPSADHWMGTDVLGRDIAARVLHGGRVSMLVGLLAAAFALLVGVPLGALAGYRGGWSDALVSRSVETLLCFPTLLLVLALLASAPAWIQELPDVPKIALVLGITGWIPIARYVRGDFIKLKTSDMVIAARATGGSHWRVMIRHILPGALAPVLITAAFSIGAAIVLEATLSFLGLGIRPPVATWGGLLADAREHVDTAWWLALFPGTALFLTVLGCNLVGEGVRDLLDPRRPQD